MRNKNNGNLLTGIRAQIKIYSDWPTFPQLYVRNELIGGLDIVKEMLEEDGDLKEALGLLK